MNDGISTCPQTLSRPGLCCAVDDQHPYACGHPAPYKALFRCEDRLTEHLRCTAHAAQDRAAPTDGGDVELVAMRTWWQPGACGSTGDGGWHCQPAACNRPAECILGPVSAGA